MESGATVRFGINAECGNRSLAIRDFVMPASSLPPPDTLCSPHRLQHFLHSLYRPSPSHGSAHTYQSTVLPSALIIIVRKSVQSPNRVRQSLTSCNRPNPNRSPLRISRLDYNLVEEQAPNSPRCKWSMARFITIGSDPAIAVLTGRSAK